MLGFSRSAASAERPVPAPRPKTTWEIVRTDGTVETIQSYWRTAADGAYWFYDDHDWRNGVSYPLVNVWRCQALDT
jgi:hypothetical protein